YFIHNNLHSATKQHLNTWKNKERAPLCEFRRSSHVKMLYLHISPIGCCKAASQYPEEQGTSTTVRVS
ncbi:MAG: hypothetical protein WBI07_02920, partial [Mobilitalea sp.]